MAVALEEHGLVRRDPAGRFDLGFELIAFGHAAAEGFPLAEMARPILEQLREVTGEGVQLFVRDGDERRCVVSLQSPHGLRWIVPEGMVLPLGKGSAGRVLAGPADSATPWLASVEEREPGVASVSAPVFDGERRVVAALSVSGPVERLGQEPGVRFGAAVVGAAEALAAALSR